MTDTQKHIEEKDVPTNPASKGQDSHLLEKDREVTDMDEEIEKEAEDIVEE